MLTNLSYELDDIAAQLLEDYSGEMAAKEAIRPENKYSSVQDFLTRNFNVYVNFVFNNGGAVPIRGGGYLRLIQIGGQTYVKGELDFSGPKMNNTAHDPFAYSDQGRGSSGMNLMQNKVILEPFDIPEGEDIKKAMRTMERTLSGIVGKNLPGTDYEVSVRISI